MKKDYSNFHKNSTLHEECVILVSFFCLQKHRVVIPNEEAILRKERQSVPKSMTTFPPSIISSPASPWHLLSDYKLFKQKVLFPSVLKRYFGIKSRRNEKKMVCLYIKNTCMSYQCSPKVNQISDLTNVFALNHFQF